jgi:hypothetical protein
VSLDRREAPSLSGLAARAQTVDGALEDGLDLLTGDAGESGQEVFDRGPALQILEEGDDGDAGAAEDPRVADLLRILLDGSASRSIHHGAIVSPLSCLF